MPDEPTMGEIVRRLDHISRQQRDMLEEIRRDREALASTLRPPRRHDLAHDKLRSDLADDIEEHDARLEKIERREAEMKNRINGVITSVAGALIIGGIIMWLVSVVISSGALA